MTNFLLKSSNTSPLAGAIRTAIGADDMEDVVCTTPEFNRPKTWSAVTEPPMRSDAVKWGGFISASREMLKSLGCQCWGAFVYPSVSSDNAVYDPTGDDEQDHRPPTHDLWVFPAEWYDSIPINFPIVDIFGCVEPFEPGVTDDDRRYGLLAYGVMVEVDE